MSFYVLTTGQIESCKIQGGDDIYVRYCIVYGKEWKFMHGIESGTSQIARRPSGEDPVFLWNHPLDFTLKSSNVYGWPRLVVSVIGHTAMGKEIIRGYGCTHLPTTSGRHTKYIPLYTPKSSSLCLQLTSWMMGTPPEFFEPTFVAQGIGREVTRVSSNGAVKVVLNISTKDMGKCGYATSDNTSRESVYDGESSTRQLHSPSRRGVSPRSSVLKKSLKRAKGVLGGTRRSGEGVRQSRGGSDTKAKLASQRLAAVSASAAFADKKKPIAKPASGSVSRPASSVRFSADSADFKTSKKS
uniref:B9 domain-containing protein 1 n=1 Tax=Lotharella oceanica TaxID=641309 RepID=A0A7S2U488_9EUKA